MKTLSYLEILEQEMQWLDRIIQYRINQLQTGKDEYPYPICPPLTRNQSHQNTYPGFSKYQQLVETHHLGQAERLVLSLALVPYINPSLLDQLYANQSTLIESRLVKSQNQSVLLPTGNTALFLLAGSSIPKRLKSQSILGIKHTFYRKNILSCTTQVSGEPDMSGLLTIEPYYRDLILNNKEAPPRFNASFPAHAVRTSLNWEDLVLSSTCESKIEEVIDHLELYDTMVANWKLQNHARAGCRILLHGESGTGKTLVAKLLGKQLSREVYRVDLSAVVSKFIGETSQRLSSLFGMAENRDWILFFDEGDALFGQRNNSMESHTNHYANQDVAYLLQRIEHHNGIVIVATNIARNMDAAFMRRFDHIVQFEYPSKEQQVRLWHMALPEAVSMAPGINLIELFTQYPLSPAAIVNAVHRLCRIAWKKGESKLGMEEVSRCVKDEALKVKGRGRY